MYSMYVQSTVNTKNQRTHFSLATMKLEIRREWARALGKLGDPRTIN